jgi:hypothetical protein
MIVFADDNNLVGPGVVAEIADASMCHRPIYTITFMNGQPVFARYVALLATSTRANHILVHGAPIRGPWLQRRWAARRTNGYRHVVT